MAQILQYAAFSTDVSLPACFMDWNMIKSLYGFGVCSQWSHAVWSGPLLSLTELLNIVPYINEQKE